MGIRLLNQIDDGFYPDPTYVVTKYSLELSWVFEELSSIFLATLDHKSKLRFYGRLADAANQHIYKHGDKNCKYLLLAVVNEAESMLK